MLLLITLAVLVFLILDWISEWRKSRSRLPYAMRGAILSSDALSAYTRQISVPLEERNHFDSEYKVMRIMKSDYQLISKIYRRLSDRNANGKKNPPAARWILDNFYVLEKQVKLIEANFDKKAYRNLPVISQGNFRGYPRIYYLATRLVTHTDSKIDVENAILFLKSCGETQVLRNSEIRIFFTMVKIALIENIASILYQANESIDQFEKAERLFGYLCEHRENEMAVQSKIRDAFPDGREISGAMLEHFLSLLKTNSKRSGSYISFIGEMLEERDTDIQFILNNEYQNAASMKITMGNAMQAMMDTLNLDLSQAFFQISPLERVLEKDPHGTYPRMDRSTREYYHSRIEEIARKANRSELRVAKTALGMASRGTRGEIQSHVGYYLLDTGQKALYDTLGARKKTGLGQRTKTVLYILSILAAVLLIELPFFLWVFHYSRGLAFVFLVLGLVALSNPAVRAVDSIICRFARRRPLPMMDYRQKLNPEDSTLVVITSLLTSRQEAEKLAENLEVFYAGNKGEHISFGILTDFKDSKEETSSEERELYTYAQELIEALNRKYNCKSFYIFHREKRYFERQKKYMAYERKRGALLELVRLIHGESETSIRYTNYDDRRFQYVFTVDSDTRLYQCTVQKLVAAMRHPLNRPVIDPERNVVTRGYGIIAPRIDTDIRDANRSLFARIFAGGGGLDSYSAAAGNFYQDVFSESIFTGKGIFSTDVFYRVLNQAFPENMVLSHDLLEGSYLRCGYLGLSGVCDGFPSKFVPYMKRLHRWIRGDYQISGRLFPRVHDARGEVIPNPLNLLSRWKIFDNLRRSMVCTSAALSFLCLLFVPKYGALIGGIFFLAVFALPVIQALIRMLCLKNMKSAWEAIKASLLEMAFLIAFAPYQAYLSANAAVMSLWRLVLSKKNMLSWTTASEADKMAQKSLWMLYLVMWPCLICSAASAAAAIWSPSVTAKVFGFLFAFVWAAAPLLLHCSSKERKPAEQELTEPQRMYIRSVAYRTFQYYDKLTNGANHYLAPDNYQTAPYAKISERTSPTNIGIQLAVYVCARDLGYLTTSDMLYRIQNVLNTIDQLPKYNGHLYNWYDTRTLEVLSPKYISTVDNGNYIMDLITVKSALKEYKKRPLLDESLLLGLCDCINLIRQKYQLRLNDKVVFDLLFTSKIPELCEIEAALDELLRSPFNEEIQEIRDLTRMTYLIKEEIKLAESGGIEQVANQIDSLIGRIDGMIDSTSFAFLYDKRKGLFSIGYNVDLERLSPSYYDLLASEARGANFVAIARGDVEEKHWFNLARTMVKQDGKCGLVSWSGTMFEYLMPNLMMESPEHSLLFESIRFAVDVQKKFARENKIPWGISESGYYAFDDALNYQYKAFGVPKLALRREEERELVLAPYASMMALMVDPDGAIRNLQQLEAMGLYGEYGFYEAVDFTHTEDQLHTGFHIIKSYMVHHQGMGFLAINNVLNQNILKRRFHRSPMIRSVAYLLEERLPSASIITSKLREQRAPKRILRPPTEGIRRELPSDVSFPKTRVYGNGSFSVVIDEYGHGYSKAGIANVTRWRRDILQKYGWYFYVSTDHGVYPLAPIHGDAAGYLVDFTTDGAKFTHHENGLETTMLVSVSPEEAMEIRKIELVNHNSDAMQVVLTSYDEITLSSIKDDMAHPAFSNLFVLTEFEADNNLLIAERKSRGEEGELRYAYAKIVSDTTLHASVETDRMKFIGRLRSLVNPAALDNTQPLSNTAGSVLDPIFGTRIWLEIPASGRIKLFYIQGFARRREEIEQIAFKYTSIYSMEKELAILHERNGMENRYLGLSAEEESEFSELLRHFIYVSSQAVERGAILSQNMLGQSDLWTMGISGDHPIVSVTLSYLEEEWYVEKLLKCYEYYRLRGIWFDLVFLIKEVSSYDRPFYQMIAGAASRMNQAAKIGNSIHIVDITGLSKQQLELLYKVSSVMLSVRHDFDGLVYEKPVLEPVLKLHSDSYNKGNIPQYDLDFYNGYGGFSKDGKEYVITLSEDNNTPLPWSNVLANPDFGAIVTESGGGYTYCKNSRENKLTPWSNDPVCDIQGEYVCIADLGTLDVFSVTKNPFPDSGAYTIRHGMGYTSYEHEKGGIAAVQTVFVPREDKIKLTKLRIQNNRPNPVQLLLTYYVKPVLGVSLSASRGYLTTLFDHTLMAKNTYNTDFPNVVAFIGTSEAAFTYTGDDREFEETVNGITAGVCEQQFANHTGAGREACMALKVAVSIDPGQSKEILFLLGEETQEEAVKLCLKYKNIQKADEALAKVKEFYDGFLSSITVSTSNKAMDRMLNGFVLYASYCSRLLARSAFYQAGGAYGFRDQLQDSLCLLLQNPELVKAQILKHASRQFKEGDVLHWWHETDHVVSPIRGVRTRFSDDRLWLCYAVNEYLLVTEDFSILEVQVPFVEGEALGESDEKYQTVRISSGTEPLYEHVIRAFEISMTSGRHGLCKMGSGDWNDGMNTVGSKGEGESVWLSMFLYGILQNWIPVMKRRGDVRTIQYGEYAKSLKQAVNENAWDGEWYLRAFFDDGTPLGSKDGAECRIDSLSQSFSVLSEIAPKERAEEAMGNAKKYLVDWKNKLIRLLDPPFQGKLKPGYIAKYVPGVRENGGQYTHAAVWMVMAFARLGQYEDAQGCYDLINPVNHTRSKEEADCYMAEPYAIAADVYTNPMHPGRGGWSFYTGAAGWFLRAGREEILGLKKRGYKLFVEPKLSPDMKEVCVRYRFFDTNYDIMMKNPNGVYSRTVITESGTEIACIPLVNDKKEHVIEVLLQ